MRFLLYISLVFYITELVCSSMKLGKNNSKLIGQDGSITRCLEKKTNEHRNPLQKREKRSPMFSDNPFFSPDVNNAISSAPAFVSHTSTANWIVNWGSPSQMSAISSGNPFFNDLLGSSKPSVDLNQPSVGNNPPAQERPQSPFTEPTFLRIDLFSDSSNFQNQNNKRGQRQLKEFKKLMEVLPGDCGNLVKGAWGRVVGGILAPMESNPWQVAIVDAHRRTLECGGSIIGDKYVLTAAHCFQRNENKLIDKSERMVYAGDAMLEKSPAQFNIKELHIHSEYSSTTRNNDIAIIIIDGAFSWNDRIKPVCLPSPHAIYNAGRKARVSGWGLTDFNKISNEDHLRSGVVVISEDYHCKFENEKYLKITDNMFCAAGNGVDTCQGDSGGPLTSLDNYRATLFGITSWGVECGLIRHPGVYVKVSHYLSWIQDHL